MSVKSANNLIWGILAAVILALFFGTWLGTSMTKVEWIGTLFLNALKMTIIPLIVSAVICGVCSLGDVRKLGKIGGVTIGYYLTNIGFSSPMGAKGMWYGMIIGLTIFSFLSIMRLRWIMKSKIKRYFSRAPQQL